MRKNPAPKIKEYRKAPRARMYRAADGENPFLVEILRILDMVTLRGSKLNRHALQREGITSRSMHREACGRPSSGSEEDPEKLI
jgi:hypothetical protein